MWVCICVCLIRLKNNNLNLLNLHNQGLCNVILCEQYWDISQSISLWIKALKNHDRDYVKSQEPKRHSNLE